MQNKFNWADQTTKHGHNLKEVVSGFQKYIRRGMEREALYFGTEIDLSGYGEYLWKRMRIIASEDIGLAEPNACAVIASLYDTYCGLKSKKDQIHAPERLMTVHAILYLARCPKSRIVDHALCVMYNIDRTNPANRMELDDFCFDKHTIRGKKMGRGFEHFFSEGVKLHNQNIPDDYFEEAKAVMMGKENRS